MPICRLSGSLAVFNYHMDIAVKFNKIRKSTYTAHHTLYERKSYSMYWVLIFMFSSRCSLLKMHILKRLELVVGRILKRVIGRVGEALKQSKSHRH